MEKDDRNSGPHIFLFPWVALGHMIPFMELAGRLTQTSVGFTVTVCSTPSLLRSLRSHKAYRRIQTVELHLPTIPGLPSHCESTSSLPPHLAPLLSKAFHACKPQLTTILQTLKPDFFIHDFAPWWAPTLAGELGIHAIATKPVGAACYSYLVSLVMGRTPNDPVSSPQFGCVKLHDYELRSLCRSVGEMAKAKDDGEEGFNDKKLAAQRQAADGIIAVKTFRFLESRFLDYAGHLTGRKVVAVGTLVDTHHDGDLTFDQSQNGLIDWLETKPKAAVVFASFGSELSMTEEEITEIALGLELSEQNFILAFRARGEEEEEGPNGKTVSVLPVGFSERIGESGVVVNVWVPQKRILRHPATGGFLTHCGWGSLCEGMALGVPLIALPLVNDQPLNARVVIGELGLGVEIDREEEGGFKRDKVAEGIKRVMVQGEEREEIRRRAKEMAERMRKEDEGAMDELVVEMERMYGGGGAGRHG